MLKHTNMTMNKMLTHYITIPSPLALLMVLFISLGPLGYAQAKDQIEVSVDRTQIYENETIELRIVGNVQFEINFGSLLSLSNLNLPEPDVSLLEQDFQILDRNQSYNVHSVNGDNRAQITWTYALAPKKNGKLTIPQITFKEAKSTPIGINVLAGKPKLGANEAPPIFLELQVDKHSAYINEQVLVSLRLYHQGNLASGELTSPDPDNAIVEQLGEQAKYTRMKFNRRYEVIERNYLLFPQKSGTLTISPQTFTGTLIDPRARQRKFAKEVTEAKTLEIKPQPKTFTGGNWLPATSVLLNENWSENIEKITVGESVTRTLTLQTLGLLGSALPSFNIDEPRGFKVYPDQEERTSQPHKAGADSKLIQSFAFVAVKPGKVTLPEIKVPWWDTVNDVQRVATIPAKEIVVIASTEQHLQPVAKLENSASTQNEIPSTQLSSSTHNNTITAAHSSPHWFWLFVFSSTGWLITLTYFLVFRRTNNKEKKVTPVSSGSNHQVSVSAIIESIKQANSNTLNLMIQWAQNIANETLAQPTKITAYHQIKVLFAGNAEMDQALSKVESSLFSQSAEKWRDNELKALEKTLNNAGDLLRDNGKTERSELPKFYPDK